MVLQKFFIAILHCTFACPHFVLLMLMCLLCQSAFESFAHWDMLFIFIMKIFCFSRQHALYIAADFEKITCHLSFKIMTLPLHPAKQIYQVKTSSFFVITLAPHGGTLLRFRKQLSKLLPKLNVCSFLPTHSDLACMAVFAWDKVFFVTLVFTMPAAASLSHSLARRMWYIWSPTGL